MIELTDLDSWGVRRVAVPDRIRAQPDVLSRSPLHRNRADVVVLPTPPPKRLSRAAVSGPRRRRLRILRPPPPKKGVSRARAFRGSWSTRTDIPAYEAPHSSIRARAVIDSILSPFSERPLRDSSLDPGRPEPSPRSQRSPTESRPETARAPLNRPVSACFEIPRPHGALFVGISPDLRPRLRGGRG